MIFIILFISVLCVRSFDFPWELQIETTPILCTIFFYMRFVNSQKLPRKADRAISKFGASG